MTYSTKMISALLLPLILSACAQEREVRVIQPEPIYDKFGDVSGCTDGRRPSQPTPGTAGRVPVNPCLPPEEDCPDGGQFDTSNGEIICIPRDDDRDPDPQGRGDRPTSTQGRR